MDILSQQLEDWRVSDGPKTVRSLEQVFGGKIFAVSFLLLMATSALPIPTGGVTHVFLITCVILAIQLVVGRTSIWIPRRWEHSEFGDKFINKLLPFLIKKIKWLEKHSKPHNTQLISNRLFLRVYGILIIVFAVAAMLAVPFSNLDTLPSLAGVGLSLAILLEDGRYIIPSLIIGFAGIYTEVFFAKEAVHLVENLKHRFWK